MSPRVKRTLQWTLLMGVIASGLSSVVFYYLMTHVPNPAIFTEYWKDVTTAQWVAAYTKWQDTMSLYTDSYGASTLATLGFAVAIGIYYFPKAALVASFSLLNLFFAWTSHVFWFVSMPFANALINWMTIQDTFIWNLIDLRFGGGSTLVVADGEALAMLTIFAGLVLLFALQKGLWRALLRSLQAVAVSCMILGAEILVFDNSEFDLHVTQIQASFGISVWFTNADLLYSGTAIFLASTVLFYLPRLQQLLRRASPREGIGSGEARPI